MAFEMTPLAYAYDALEPHIITRAMEVHHGLHHKAYLAKFNAALEKHPEVAAGKTAEDILKDLNAIPEDIRTAVRNNGGGFVNHNLYFSIMAPGAGGNPTGAIAGKIDEAFGSFEAFKEQFNAAGAGQFGSGWVWLVVNPQGALEIMTTANQDSPVSQGYKTVMVNDVWEHAYYLTYENRRPDYLKAWWNVVNWDAVNARFA